MELSAKPNLNPEKIRSLAESQRNILVRQNALISQFKSQKGKDMSQLQLQEL